MFSPGVDRGDDDQLGDQVERGAPPAARAQQAAGSAADRRGDGGRVVRRIGLLGQGGLLDSARSGPAARSVAAAPTIAARRAVSRSAAACRGTRQLGSRAPVAGAETPSARLAAGRRSRAAATPPPPGEDLHDPGVQQQPQRDRAVRPRAAAAARDVRPGR